MRNIGGVAAGAIVLLLLSGCNGVDEEEPAMPDETAAPGLGERPDVTVAVGDGGAAPPDGLLIDDLVPGDGERAHSGATLTVHYVGVAWSSQEEFDASWDRDQPLTFPLGEGRVIEGWDRGLEGMRVGGRRQLTVPPELAYGDRGVEGAIAPGETLVFTVDLLELDPAR